MTVTMKTVSDPAQLAVAIESIQIPTKPIADVRSAVLRHFHLRHLQPSPLLTVIGPPLAGKTRALQVAAGCRRCEDNAPIPGTTVLAELRSRAAAGELHQVILRQADAPAYSARGIARRAQFVANQLSLRKVDTLIVDNAHFLVADDGALSASIGVLAHLALHGGMSIVLSGRDTVQAAANELAHATGLSAAEVEIAPVPANSDGLAQLDAFLLLFSEELLSILPGLNCEGLEDPAFVMRMLLASKGRFGLATRVILQTLVDNIGQADPLALKCFSETWRHFAPRGASLNPFAGTKPPQLQQIQEIFARDASVGHEAISLPSRPKGKGKRLWAG